MPELKLENVSYQYKHGDRKVVNEVTCLFEGGKLNSVVGPSGSGKTTLGGTLEYDPRTAPST